jgi:hypothetical protein
MALQKQLVPVPFTGGLNQKVNEHLLPLSQFRTLANCFYAKTGKLRMRAGTSQVGSNVSPANAMSTLAAINNELVQMDGQSLWSWSPSDDAWYRIDGMAPSCDVRVGSVFGNMEVESTATGPDPVALGDVAVNGDFACYIGQSNGASPGGLVYRVVDLESGTVMEGGLVLDADESGCAKVVASSTDDFWIFYQSAAAPANLVMFSITNVGTGTITVGSPTNLVTDLGTAGIFDIISDASKSFLGLVYVDTSDDMKIASYSTIGSATPVTGYPITVTGTYSKVAIGEMSAAADWVIVYFDVANNGVFFRAYNKADNSLTRAQTLVEASTTTGAEFAQISLTEHATNSTWIVWTEYEDTDALEASGQVKYMEVTWSGGGGYVAGSGLELMHNCVLVGRPFAHSVFDHIVVPVAMYDAGGTADSLAPHSGTLLLAGRDITVASFPGGSNLGFPMARCFVRRMPSYLKTVSRVASLGSNRFLMSTLRVDTAGLSQVGIDPGSYPIRVVAALVGVTFDLTPAEMSTCQSNGVLLVAAGNLVAYDGEGVFPAGFMGPPPVGEALMSAVGAGGSLTAGEYSAALVFMMRDAKGNEYYSGASFDPGQDTVTAVLNDSILLDPLPSSEPTIHFFQVLLLFRTAANGAIHYLDTIMPPNGVWDDATLSQADSAITSNAVLYTDAGEVEHVLPPTPYCIATDGTVVLLVPGEDRLSIWQSLPVRKNLGVAFSDQLVFGVPAGSDLTAVTFLDGRPIWFRDSEVGFLLGTPPTAAGTGGYTEARAIAVDVGAEDFRGIVQIPDGLVFKSAKGFYLLGRDLSVSYVGAPVENYNSQTVNSSMLHAELNQAWFAMSGGDVLVFDYEKNLWSTFTGFPGGEIKSLATHQGTPILGNDVGSVYEMDDGRWDDGEGNPVEASFQTGWATLAGLLGFQRLYRVGLTGTIYPEGGELQPHALTVQLYKDFDLSGAEAMLANIPDTTVVDAGPEVVPFEIRMHNPSQKGSAFSFKVTWSLHEGATSGSPPLEWTGLTLELGMKRGMRKLPPAGSF